MYLGDLFGLDGLNERLLHSQASDPDFKAWFGDSKIVDARGNPLIVFHQTAQENVDSIESGGFDLTRAVARATDSQVPDGIFFKLGTENIGVSGRDVPAAQMACYLSIQNPLHVRNREALQAIVRTDPLYRQFSDKVDQTDKRLAASYDKLWDRIPQRGRPPPARPMTDLQMDAAGDKLTAQCNRVMKLTATVARERLTAVLKAEGYDGLWMDADVGGGLLGRSFAPTTIIAFSPDQVRSAKADRQAAINRSWDD